MAEAGVLVLDTHAGTKRLYDVLSTSERFESTGRRGEYKLVAEESSEEAGTEPYQFPRPVSAFG